MERLRFVYKHFRFPRDSYERAIAEVCTGKPYYRGRHGVAVHYRRGDASFVPNEHGGYTKCCIYDELDINLPLSVGIAECSPHDNFSYRIGRDIARGRAQKNFISRAGALLLSHLLRQE